MKKVYNLLPVILMLVIALVATLVACEKDAPIIPSTTVVDGTMVSKKPAPPTTGGNSLDSLYARCGMTKSDTGITYPVITLSNLQVTHRSIGGHDAIQISWTAPVIAGKTIAGYYFAAGPCDGRPDCGYHNQYKLSQVTTNTTNTMIVVQYGLSWLWTGNYIGCIHVLTSEGCMYMSQVFSFTGPQY